MKKVDVQGIKVGLKPSYTTGSVVKKNKKVTKEKTSLTDEEIITDAFSGVEDRLEDYLDDLKAFEEPAKIHKRYSKWYQ